MRKTVPQKVMRKTVPQQVDNSDIGYIYNQQSAVGDGPRVAESLVSRASFQSFFRSKGFTPEQVEQLTANRKDQNDRLVPPEENWAYICLRLQTAYDSFIKGRLSNDDLFKLATQENGNSALVTAYLNLLGYSEPNSAAVSSPPPPPPKAPTRTDKAIQADLHNKKLTGAKKKENAKEFPLPTNTAVIPATSSSRVVRGTALCFFPKQPPSSPLSSVARPSFSRAPSPHELPSPVCSAVRVTSPLSSASPPLVGLPLETAVVNEKTAVVNEDDFLDGYLGSFQPF